MTVKNIEYLSPSNIHYLYECKFRYILSQNNFSKDKQPKVFNKNTFLGILMHLVLENYLKRRCNKDDFQQIWDEMFNLLIDEYNIEISEIELIKYHLPFYQVKKNMLLRILNHYNFNLKGYELELEKDVFGGLVKGKADIIFDNKSEKKVRIVDFKTGPIFSYVNGESQSIKSSYKFQLLTYGYVYWLKGYTSENITCILQGLSKSQVEEMVFTNQDYQNHEKLLINLKTSINQSINKGLEDSLANPNPTGCIYCDYNHRCDPLRKSLSDKVEFPSLLVINYINAESFEIEFKVNIKINGDSQSIYNVPIKIYDTFAKLVKDGNPVFVTGLYFQENSTIKYWTKYTKFFI